MDGKNNHATRMKWMKEQKKSCVSAGFIEKSQIDNHLIMETEMR